MERPELTVRFWGVRGSIACPGADWVRYGGNTACVELRCGNCLLIFDAGTGLRPLGQALLAESPTVTAELFLSHTHLDHIYGLPFFAPCFGAGNRLRFWAGHLTPPQRLSDALHAVMAPPLFPDVRSKFGAEIDFVDFRAGETLAPHSDVRVRTSPLAHPGGATGYRVEWAGKSVAYVTDIEHRPPAPDPAVLALVERADIMIYDADYTEEEFRERQGWGHSTWQEAVRIGDQAAVKTVVLFHHDASHTDTVLDDIAEAARRARPGTLVAREGLTLTL